MIKKLIDTTGKLGRQRNGRQKMRNPYEQPFCDDWDNEKRKCLEVTIVPCPYYDIDYVGFCRYRYNEVWPKEE